MTALASRLGLAEVRARAFLLGPGITLSAVVAVAAMALGAHYGAPVMLFALLLGMALNFLSQDDKSAAGIEFTARQVLRFGVALLGLRITVAQVAALGWAPVLMVLVAVAATIVVGIVLARLMGFRMFFGLLTGGAVAICGASAALALSAAMPAHPLKERATLFTVIGVSTLSTLAMVLYPVLTQALGMAPVQAGFFIGGTIHDVAQVVGAGYLLGKETGDAAPIVKLFRVSMLALVVIAVSAAYRSHRSSVDGADPPSRPALVPWFLWVFAALVILHSMHFIPDLAQPAIADVSRSCLVLAIGALGVKTSFQMLFRTGWRPFALLLVETIWLACALLVAIVLSRPT